MNQNTIRGTARKSHTTPTGLVLERGYIYLTPEAWAVLYRLSSAIDLSASEYLASLISTDNGATPQGFKHDTNPRNRT